jgi:hypothetical protein
MPNPGKFHWARRVSRAKVRRLYQSDAQGMLDLDLLDEVGYGMYARCRDMFEVQQARDSGQVPCRHCHTPIPRQGHRWPHARRKAERLRCGACDWQVTWGEYYDSYSGNRMLPGSAEQAFRAYLERWPRARTPAEKLRAIDALIHDFHVNFGIDGRPVGENVISGTKEQVVELIEGLAYGTANSPGLMARDAWRARLNDPVRVFRQAHSWARVKAIAAELGIEERSKMREDELVAEILRRDPRRLEKG